MPEMDLARQLRELAQLHAEGAISDEEFVRAKERLLPRASSSIPPGASAQQPAHDDEAEEREAAFGSPAGGLGAASTALIGGLVALVAFFALPVATLPFFGRIAASDMAALARASKESSLAVLWLIPAMAAATAGLTARVRFASDVTPALRRGTFFTVFALSALILVIYLFVLVRLQFAMQQSGGLIRGPRATDFMGAGFWVVAAAAVVAGGAALVGLNGPARTAGTGTRGGAVSHVPATRPYAENTESHEPSSPADAVGLGPQGESGELPWNARRYLLMAGVMVVAIAALIVIGRLLQVAWLGEPTTPAPGTTAIQGATNPEPAAEGQGMRGSLKIAGQPVIGAKITVATEDGQLFQEVVTDAQGVWQVRVQDNGKYQVTLDLSTLPGNIQVRGGRNVRSPTVYAGNFSTVLFALEPRTSHE